MPYHGVKNANKQPNLSLFSNFFTLITTPLLITSHSTNTSLILCTCVPHGKYLRTCVKQQFSVKTVPLQKHA